MGILAALGLAPAPTPPQADLDDGARRILGRTGAPQPGDTDGRDTHTDPRYHVVGGVVVDTSSAEYAAWYREYYG